MQTLRRRDPYAEDLIEASVALALKDANPAVKDLARRHEVDVRSIRRWRSTGKGPLGETAKMVYHLGRRAKSHAYSIIALLKGIAAQGEVADVSNAELAARYWTLRDEEEQAEGEGNVAAKRIAQVPAGDWAAMDAAMAEEERTAGVHASRSEELMGVLRELRRRRVDPRKYL